MAATPPPIIHPSKRPRNLTSWAGATPISVNGKDIDPDDLLFLVGKSPQTIDLVLNSFSEYSKEDTLDYSKSLEAKIENTLEEIKKLLY